MKKLHILFALIASLAGCDMKEMEMDHAEDDIFTASMEEFDGGTRTAMTSGLDVVWSEGDQLTIFRGSHLADKYQVMSQYAGKPYGDFEMIDEGNAGNSFSSGTELPANIAVYPYDDAHAVSRITSEEGVSYTVSGVSFPSVQQYAKDSFADNSFIMAAVTSSVSDHRLRFRNAGGAMRIRLKGSGIVRSISLKGNRHESLAGIADVKIAYDSTPSVVFTTAAEKVTLDCGMTGVALGASATDFIISLPPVEFTKGFTVVVEDINGHVQELTATRFNEVKRSSVLTMPERAICFDQPENPEGLFMYRGYLDLDIIVDLNLLKNGTGREIYKLVDKEVIDEAITRGLIVEEPLETKNNVPFDNMSEGNVLLFAIPASSSLKVYKDDGWGEAIPFNATILYNGNTSDSFTNGDIEVLLEGGTYKLYGEIQTIPIIDGSLSYYIK